MIKRDLIEPEALYFLWWQAVAFRLPLAQQEALGWWDPPPCFHGLHLQDILPYPDASGMRNFWTIRQEKNLSLASTLQCCAERSAQTGVFCNMAWELQKCMAPLMYLNREDIVKASLLEPMGNKPRTSPTQEEEAALLGEEQGLPEAPEATAPLQEYLQTPKPKEPIMQIGDQRTPASSKTPP